jgi:hypothetical protein
MRTRYSIRFFPFSAQEKAEGIFPQLLSAYLKKSFGNLYAGRERVNDTIKANGHMHGSPQAFSPSTYRLWALIFLGP